MKFLGYSLQLIFISLLLTKAAQSQTPVEISTKMDGILLGKSFYLLEDESESLGLNDVLALERQGQFKKSEELIVNYGLNPSAQWAKFVLRNPAATPITIVLENDFTMTDTIALYYKTKNGQWRVKESGDQIEFQNRDINTRQVAFRLELEPGDHSFYMRIDTKGALQLPLYLWSPDEFFAHNAIEYIFIGVLVGCHIVISLYNLFLYSSLKDKTYLSYVCYVLSNLLYQGAVLGIFQQLFSVWGMAETVPNAVVIAAVDFCAISSLVFGTQFLNLKERFPLLHKMFLVCIGLSVLNLSVTIFISTLWGNIFCFVTASLATNLIIFAGVMVVKSGYRPAVYYLIAWLFYLLGVTGSVTNLLGFVPSSGLTQWGQFTGGAFEVAILSLALGSRINAKRREYTEKVKELNQTLEIRVAHRTAEIQSLFNHIPQGILMIGDDGKIEPNYSKQLVTLLEHDDIKNRRFLDAVLDYCEMSSDQKDQAWQAILGSLGSHYLNFDANSDKLPSQFWYQYKGERKSFKLTWNYELDDDEDIRHLLVTILDVSAEVIAAEKLEEKDQIFKIIHQLVEIKGKKSIQFFKSCQQLIDENSRLIENGSLNLDTLKILFVNAHTIKGAARTLHLDDIANGFHKIEVYYSTCLKDGQEIDQQRVSEEFNGVVELYNTYHDININMLGRKEEGTTITLDREFIQDNLQLLSELANYDDIPYDIKKMIHSNIDTLTDKILTSLNMILSEALSSTDKVAKDLGKSPPNILIEVDEGILIDHDQEEAIKRSLVHIVRNILDHGIETGEERLQAGKKESGHIYFEAETMGERMQLLIRDDGAGLNLSKIREKCEELEIDSTGWTDHDFAQMIFKSGFSTTDSVSLVSGRGVGMNAIKKYIEDVGGNVGVTLLEPIDGTSESRFRFQTFIELPIVENNFPSGARQVG